MGCGASSAKEQEKEEKKAQCGDPADCDPKQSQHTPRGSKYGLLFATPPRNPSGDNANLETAAQEAITDGFALDEMGEPEQKILLFLYAREVKKTARRDTRVSEFQGLLNGSGDYAEMRERIDKLLDSLGDTTCDTVPEDVQRFDAATFPGWQEKDTSFVLWRDQLSGVPHQRVQKSRLCYVHAPVVAQRYLVLLNQQQQAHQQQQADDLQPRHDPGQIDMSKFIRRYFSAAELDSHVFSDSGGSTKTTVKRILVPGTQVLHYNYSQSPTDFETILRQYGPAVIAHFQVDEAFCRGSGPFISASARGGAVKGGHAMLVVGCRWNEKRQLRLLVQNWWKDKQFVEVDLAYLRASEAELVFVETPQPHIPDKYELTTTVYAENEMLDMPDEYEHDGGM